MDEYEYDYLETGQEHLGDSTSIAGVKTEQDNLPAVDAVHNYNKPRTSIPNEVDDVSNRLGRVSLSSNDSIDDFNYDYTSSMPSSLTTGTQATALPLTSARYTHRPYKGSHIQREPPVQTPELRDTSSSGNQSQYTAYTPSTNYTQMHQYGYPGLGNNYIQQPQYVHQELGADYVREPQYGYQDSGSGYIQQSPYTFAATGAFFSQNVYSVQAKGMENDTSHMSNHERSGSYTSPHVQSADPVQSPVDSSYSQTPHPKHSSRNPAPLMKISSTPRRESNTSTRSRGQNHTMPTLERGNSRYSGDVYPQPGLSAYTSSYYEHSKQQSITVGVVNPYDENKQRPFASGPVPSSSTWDPGYVADFDSNEKLQGLKYPIEDGDDELLGDLADQQMTSGNNMPADRNAYAVSKGKSPDTQYSKPKKAKRYTDHRFSIHPSKDFWPGRVLKIEWSQPMGANAKVYAPSSAFSTRRDDVFTKDRRFILLEQWEGHSIGVPILTYGNQGCKPNAHPECHGIVHTGHKSPALLSGEAQLGFSPVRMIPENDMDRLHPSSRVNYMKKYTIEHNYPVNFVGHLHRADYMNLQEQLQQIQSQPESSSVFEYGGMPE